MSTNFKVETNLKNYSSLYCNTDYAQCLAVYLGMQIPIFLKQFIPIYLNLKHFKVLPLSSKYTNFVSMLCSQRYCSNVRAYVIDNIQTFRFFIDFSLIYLKKLPHLALICFLHVFYFFKVNIVTTKQRSVVRCFQVVGLL